MKSLKETFYYKYLKARLFGTEIYPGYFKYEGVIYAWNGIGEEIQKFVNNEDPALIYMHKFSDSLTVKTKGVKNELW